MVSFLPCLGFGKLLVKIIRADICLVFMAKFELFLQKEIVSGCALVFNVVLKKSFG